jgi:hypothetical protein
MTTHEFLTLVDCGGAVEPDKRVIVGAAQCCNQIQRLRVVGHDDDLVCGPIPQDVEHLGHDSKLARERFPPRCKAATARPPIIKDSCVHPHSIVSHASATAGLTGHYQQIDWP